MKTSEILVSIIMPVYNVEDYLEESLMSVANQTFKDFELIIINDGSTDGSEVIIHDFMTKFEQLNILYIKQDNAGQSSARNKGISQAKGEYIYFFDSDDLIDKKAIETLYHKSKVENFDMLLFSGESFYETDDVHATQYTFNYLKKEYYTTILNGQELFVELINNDDYSTSPCLYFVKKDLLLNKNLRFYEGIIHEDALFTYQVILSATRTKVINEVLFYRRVRLNSTMTSKNHAKRFIGIYTVLTEMIRFKQKLDTSSVNLELAIHDRLSDAFGNAANQYINIEQDEQIKYENEFSHLKAIGEEYKYFGRIDYWLFGKQKFLYSILRKSFNFLKERKGK